MYGLHIHPPSPKFRKREFVKFDSCNFVRAFLAPAYFARIVGHILFADRMLCNLCRFDRKCFIVARMLMEQGQESTVTILVGGPNLDPAVHCQINVILTFLLRLQSLKVWEKF